MISGSYRHLRPVGLGICLLSVLWAVCGVGCGVGAGEGFVRGRLEIADCNEEEPLSRPDFDLDASYFVADPFPDRASAVSERRSRLNVRIQGDSGTRDNSNGLDLLFQDVAAAARLFVQRRPLPIEENQLCSALGCTSRNALVRAQFRIYNTCPTSRAALTGFSAGVTQGTPPRPGAVLCNRPESPAPPPCPAVDADRLDALCARDFNDPSLLSEIDAELGGGACMYLCEWGAADHGQALDSLDAFKIDFGDRIGGLFSMRLLDARSVVLDECVGGSGQLTGTFRFEVVRNRSAQTFP